MGGEDDEADGLTGWVHAMRPEWYDKAVRYGIMLIVVLALALVIALALT